MGISRIQVKNLRDIWEVDKKLLATGKVGTEVISHLDFPTDQLFYSLLVKRTELLMNPPSPLELTLNHAVEEAKKMAPEIANIWKVEYGNLPNIEVHNSTGYLMRISELEDDTNNQTGTSAKSRAPPSSFYSAHHNTLLLPNHFLARQERRETRGGPLDTSVYKDNWITTEHSWNKHYFELVLADSLCKALFRKVRGETLEGYLQMFEQVGENSGEIMALNEAIGSYTAQELTLKHRPDWGFYTVGDRIISIWGNRFNRANFLGVEALTHQKTLGQIAMLDLLKADENTGMVYYDLFKVHPNYLEKKRKYERE